VAEAKGLGRGRGKAHKRREGSTSQPKIRTLDITAYGCTRGSPNSHKSSLCHPTPDILFVNPNTHRYQPSQVESGHTVPCNEKMTHFSPVICSSLPPPPNGKGQRIIFQAFTAQRNIKKPEIYFSCAVYMRSQVALSSAVPKIS